MKHHLAAALTLCLGLGISCSSGTKSGQPGGTAASSKAATRTVNACDLVTLQDVREIYGPTMAVDPHHTATDRGPAADLSRCFYLAPAGLRDLSVNVVARVSHVGEDAYGNHDLFIKQSKEQLPDFTFEEVEGLGAPAIWQTEGSSVGNLTLFLGTARLAVVASSMPGKDRKDIAVSLMKMALARFRSMQ
jgi:hypothetical protein